jgi:hypothetical protein
MVQRKNGTTLASICNTALPSTSDMADILLYHALSDVERAYPTGLKDGATVSTEPLVALKRKRNARFPPDRESENDRSRGSDLPLASPQPTENVGDRAPVVRSSATFPGGASMTIGVGGHQ